jgi:CRP/FNR family transcriptional regulator
VTWLWLSISINAEELIMYAPSNVARQNISVSKPVVAGETPTLSSIFHDKPVETFEAGRTIFCEDDAAKHVFQVVEGVLRVFKIIGDGRRAITGFLYPGDLVGVSMRDTYLYSVETIGQAKIRRFSRTAFQDAINLSPELRPQLFAILCDEMAAAQDQMVLLSRKNAEERLCTFLLWLANRMGSAKDPDAKVKVPMTRLDMADYLGLTIETVSRTMSSLVNRGIISTMGRHDIRILKRDTLMRLAGDYNAHDGMDNGQTYSRQAVWPSA